MQQEHREVDRQQEAMRRVLSYRAFRLMKREGISKERANAQVVEQLRGDFDLDWESLAQHLQPDLEAKNHKFLSTNGVDLASIWVTPVMVKKSITDATEPIRFLLKSTGIHDYTTQAQGQEAAVRCPVVFIDTELTTRKISFYRPKTKKGDPRLWPERMGRFCEPGDEVGLAVVKGICVVLNLSKYDYQSILSQPHSWKTSEEQIVLGFLTGDGVARLSESAQKLLLLLKGLVGTPLTGWDPKTSGQKRDTDVGMAVEKALGIPPNAKKTPDFHGIELKSWRNNGGRDKNRHTLFCQVPDWTRTKERSGIGRTWDFVQRVGYPVRDSVEMEKIPPEERKIAKELRCTVQAGSFNSQHLSLKVNDDEVIEFQMRDGAPEEDLLVWTGEKLRERLRKKHPETFWISCRTSKSEGGREVFFVEKVTYTRSPLVAQFLSLIEQGVVSLDHMIGYRGGAISERGPAFKIWGKDLSSIFPAPIEINLLEGKEGGNRAKV